MSDNELIAEFMGWKKYTNAYGNAYKCPNIYPIENSYKSGWTTFMQDQLEFNVRWDSFMPVANKFFSMIFRIDPPKEYLDHCVLISEKILEVKIQEAFERLVDGIKWYNTQKP